LALIRRIRGNGKTDERGMPLTDLGSLPPECTENDLVNAGALTGLLIGAVKQLAAKVESLEKQLKKLKRLDKMSGKTKLEKLRQKLQKRKIAGTTR